MHGAEAAWRLGLSTQIPMQPVFLTTGPSRRFRFGQMTVRLRHAPPRQLLLAGRPAGMAFAALCYLDKRGVNLSTIAEIQRRLPEEEFKVLQAHVDAMPARMRAVFQQYTA